MVGLRILTLNTRILKLMHAKKSDEGRMVTFKAVCIYDWKKATRIIKKVHIDGWAKSMIEVRYAGYGNFYVKHNEIIEIFDKE